ncbi:UNVERIFIED_CONTAM: protein PHR1-LIKE 2 [Sesamum calycinum]|uniref:Protein PHR1-LIKE 2 n=1 Tax=Sesamum calycinum TaxID=2727403 RepID=A0AAW2MCB8_9LAMI
MYPRLIQPREPILGPESMQAPNTAGYGQRAVGDPCLVLTSDPKPRLRWTADLHDRFVDAVTQLGGPSIEFVVFVECRYSGYWFIWSCMNSEAIGVEAGDGYFTNFIKIKKTNHIGILGICSFGYQSGLRKSYSKAILRTMGVKGLTLFHLKSHLQKYRLGKQSGKEFGDSSKDGSYLLDSPRASNSPQNLPVSDPNEGYEVKEALRAQMEVQSKLHLQVEAEKHLQTRQDAEKRYIAMLERTCKMLADQILGAADTSDDADGFEGKGTKVSPSAPLNHLGSYPSQSADEVGINGPGQVSPKFHPQPTDCSTESCLTSHESPVGRKAMVNMDSTNGSLIWGESNLYTPDLHIQVNSHGVSGPGV